MFVGKFCNIHEYIKQQQQQHTIQKKKMEKRKLETTKGDKIKQGEKIVNIISILNNDLRKNFTMINSSKVMNAEVSILYQIPTLFRLNV